MRKTKKLSISMKMRLLGFILTKKHGGTSLSSLSYRKTSSLVLTILFSEWPFFEIKSNYIQDIIKSENRKGKELRREKSKKGYYQLPSILCSFLFDCMKHMTERNGSLWWWRWQFYETWYCDFPKYCHQLRIK